MISHGAVMVADIQSNGFGDDLAHHFWLDEAKSHVSRELRRGPLAVTQIRSDRPTPEPSQSLGYNEAYLIGFMVEDVPDHELWQDGKPARTESFRAGQTALFDLRRDPINFTRTAHHSLHFFVPRTALLEIAEQEDMRFSGELNFCFASAYEDPIIQGLGLAALSALESPTPATGLFLDHLLQSVAAHSLGKYGMTGHVATRRGGLTSRQLRMAEEIMEASLEEDLALGTLAAACGLSISHFARAFRISTGQAPYQRFLDLRIARAKALLRCPDQSLSEIAHACGFADQSHFTRTFRRAAGMPPGRWRRLV